MSFGPSHTALGGRPAINQQPCGNRDSLYGVSLTNCRYKYFAAGRKMIDITECRDIETLQTIILMVMFLHCSARLITTYSYLGIAVVSAIRMGLHRALEGPFNAIEVEMRRRCWWTCWKMATCKSSHQSRLIHRSADQSRRHYNPSGVPTVDTDRRCGSIAAHGD